MGILGFQKLQTDDVVGGCNKLQMMDKINEWKIKHPDQQPIVVIRLKELLMAIIQLNVKAAVFGGSHRYYHEQLDRFFRHFNDVNVKLVFFGGGSKSKDRLAKMTAKADQDYKKYSQLLNHLDEKNELKLCARSELRMCLGLYEEGIARKYGEYFLSTGASLNRDIVEYSRANENVVAILAKDSDFLLYNLGSVEYWSCGIEHLNFNDMTTVSFNQAAMLDHLNLSQNQFHVMVAIAGVILDDPKNRCYHVAKGVFKQRNPGSVQIIRSISDCVREKVPTDVEKPTFGAWTTMMFVSRTEEYCWLIEKQFKKYDVCTNKASVAESACDDANVTKKYKNIWAIVDDEVIRVDLNFIDIGRWNSNRNAMLFHNLFVLVFKRAMGIVLHSKRDEAPTRRFLMKGREKERCKILSKTLAYSSLDVPTVEKLMDETSSADEEFQTRKWDLLYWVLHLNFADDIKHKIRNLPRDMSPVVVTVLFLLWEHQITPLEGDALIISENDMLKQPAGVDKVDYPTKPDGRTIRIAHIYVHTRVLINRCFQICGIDLFNVPVSFDGIHFHNLMTEFVENADVLEDKRADIEGFQIAAF